jgi:hypothetical protein
MKNMKHTTTLWKTTTDTILQTHQQLMYETTQSRNIDKYFINYLYDIDDDRTMLNTLVNKLVTNNDDNNIVNKDTEDKDEIELVYSQESHRAHSTTTSGTSTTKEYTARQNASKSKVWNRLWWQHRRQINDATTQIEQ